MSDYDPVQVSPLQPEELARLRDAALAAISGAPDLDALAQVRTDHVSGRAAPLVLARRELGALPPQARADAGRRHNEAVGAVQAAFDERLSVLTAQRDARSRTRDFLISVANGTSELDLDSLRTVRERAWR